MGPSEKEGMSRIVTVIPGSKDEGTSKISKQLLKLINVEQVNLAGSLSTSFTDIHWDRDSSAFVRAKEEPCKGVATTQDRTKIDIVHCC